jgi:hypothetical protein
MWTRYLAFEALLNIRPGEDRRETATALVPLPATVCMLRFMVQADLSGYPTGCAP